MNKDGTMDFFDEMLDALAHDGAKRGVRLEPQAWTALLSAPERAAAANPASRSRTPAAAEPRAVAPEPAARPPEPAPPEPVSAAGEFFPECRTSAVGLPDNWDQLREVVLACTRCRLAQTRTHVVFGEGDVHAPLMFVGEGPGAEEDATGRPFVGEAGQLLTKMIAAMRFRREEVYIANVVKCRPPGNRVPEDDEAAECLGYLRKQIELVKPAVIVLLGATALRFLLQKNGIRRCRGVWHEYRGIPVMPTYHPAYLLRQASAKRDVWNDLKMVMAKLGKTP